MYVCVSVYVRVCVLGMLGPASSSGRTDEQSSGQVKDGDMVTSSLGGGG